MPDKPNLYDLFDEKSLRYWEAQVRGGKLPTRTQLADLVEANAERPLPLWLISLITGTLRGELKSRPGRPTKRAFDRYVFAAAAYDYKLLLRKIQANPAAKPKERRNAHKASSEPLHVQAAKQVIQDWKLAIDWRSFLNQISSEK